MAIHANSTIVRRTGQRVRLEAAIENAIAALDRLDGDPDFEPEPDDEPAEAELNFQPELRGGAHVGV